MTSQALCLAQIPLCKALLREQCSDVSLWFVVVVDWFWVSPTPTPPALVVGFGVPASGGRWSAIFAAEDEDEDDVKITSSQ